LGRNERLIDAISARSNVFLTERRERFELDRRQRAARFTDKRTSKSPGRAKNEPYEGSRQRWWITWGLSSSTRVPSSIQLPHDWESCLPHRPTVPTQPWPIVMSA